MKNLFKKKGVQKVTAIMLSAIIMLSAFAMLPADLFKVSAASADNRLELDFNNNWKFYLGDVVNAEQKSFDDSSWGTVELPHDFSISQDFFAAGVEAESGNLPGGTGWYRKMFSMPSAFSGKSVILNFDGAYKDTWVYVNGQLIGENHYGYNSFSFDISEYLTCNGKTANFIAVKVENELPSSRWYSGSGIYRDVSMTVTDKLHVDLYGTYVTTPDLEASNGTNGNVDAKVTLVNNDSQSSVTVKAEILDASGSVVGTADTKDVTVNANQKLEVTLNPSLQNPNLWSSWDEGTPYLYTLRTTVVKNGKTIDVYNTKFGYRWIEWTVDNGFYLNGNAVKLQGVCMHHDQGALGASQVYDAIYRQVAILKDMGCNAIRTSHNTASRVFMDICNELGMMVMAEFFDGWNYPKNGNSNDFSEYFNQTIPNTNNLLNAESGQKWYQFVLTQSVKRDRNDPSVIIWDVGNELAEGTVSGDNTVDVSVYEANALDMRNMMDALDPTRPITEGNNRRNITSGWPAAVDQYMTVLGGNYQPGTWIGMKDQIASHEDAKTGATGKPFVMTEITSALSTRGHYANSGTGTNGNYDINAYDTTTVGWGTLAAESWYWMITNDWASGEFVWTGFDYIGEPTTMPNTSTNNTGGTNGAGNPNSSYFGIIDTAGFAKDSYYLYRSMWNKESTTLHLVPGTWDSGKVYVDSSGYVDVAVYSNADKIELYAGNTKIAESVATTTTTSAGHTYQTWSETATNSSYCNTTEFCTATGKDMYSQFHVRYASVSELSVKAYEKQANGSYTEITDTVGTNKISSVSTSKVVASTWAPATTTYAANGDGYVYIEYEAQDANGNFDSDYNGTIEIEIQGSSASIVGVDNGDPVATKRFQQSSAVTSPTTATVDMFNGRALVILRTKTQVGEVEVVTSATDGTAVNGVTVSVVAETGEDLDDEFEEVVDQTNVVYEPTLAERYAALEEQLAQFGGGVEGEESGNYTYNRYTASTSGAPVANGDYIIYNQNYIMTGTSHSTGGAERMSYTPSDNVITTDVTNDYKFTLVSGTTNQYYIQNSEGKYLSIGSGNESLDLVDTQTAVTVETTSNGMVTIRNGSQYVDHFSSASTRKFDTWQVDSSGVNENETMVLYSKTGPASSGDGSTSGTKDYTIYTANTTTTPVENGTYVIYNDASNYYRPSQRIMSGSTTSGGIAKVDVTPNNNVITTSTENAYTFTQVNGKQYYVQNSAGQYISFGSANGSLTLTSTATTVTVEGLSDGRILIYNGSQFLDHYRDEGRFSSWSSSVSGAADNNKMRLYREPATTGGGGTGGDSTVPAEKADLYAALQEGIQYAPGSYTNRSYTEFIEAMEAGLAVLKDESADETAITNATTAINDAIAALEIYRKTFPATLYKYGYNPTASNPYSVGGAAFNEKTYASMEAKIKADENLVNQIKTVIGYDDDSIAWGGQTYKDAALESAVEKYAMLYSLAFTGQPVTGTGNSSDFEITAWNAWIKDNTQGANESNDEGASVQGLFSANLVDGKPSDHAAYASLPYGNVSSARPAFNTGDGISFTYSIDGSSGNNITIENLPALEDISVHINDMFKKEDVLVNPDDPSEGYAKYYWDFDFPLVTTTNEFGVNKYVYDSSSDEYLFQATFDDENHRATANINYVDDWNVTLSGDKGNGRGFFPFNYVNGATPPASTADTENAVYHYALGFDMNFHVPSSGHYGDGEDIIFDFEGDDDVLVYIDGVLVLDNGGLHAARGASINFTEQSVSYQFAMDVAEGVVKDPNGVLADSDTTNDAQLENSVTYTYGAANEGISADNLAALEKLHEVATNNGYHTLSFYFVERGSTDSNFKVELNIQEISSNVQLVNQTYAADFGIPISYNTRNNDKVSQEALDEGLDVQYLGITDANVSETDVFSFVEPTNITQYFAGTMSQFDVNGTKYGDCTINSRGTGVYTLNTMNMTGMDYFYNVAKVGNDPTYNESVDYYVYERVRFIPATTIYFEDNFTGITYTDGTTADGSGYGVWSTVGDEALFEDAVQVGESVDDADVLPFGYDPAYDNCTTYSGHSAKMVTVSNANNTRQGGTNPTVEFTFTGTGFDVISLTDSTSGVFAVELFDENGNRVGKRKIVNTYYGYGYGQLYADENGDATLTVNDKPLYKTNDGHVTTNTTYYNVDENGQTFVSATVSYLDVSGSGYTENPTYYDADGNLTTAETETPAYAYAYAFGWVDSDDANTVGIYQVPVIKMSDLDYGKYTVKITPTYSSMQDVKGNGSYSLYVDAIRIYDPAGVDDAPGTGIVNGYIYNKEGYPAYLQMKDMLIGADSLGVNDTQGVIFIDGIAALNNDLETYKTAGPNNELYLAKDQAVAFEVWATGIPESVQIGASSAQGTATLGVTYGTESAEKLLNTSTDMYYDINSLLPVGGKLTWTRTVVNGVTYYKTNTIVIQNTSDAESIMAISNVKWTFTGVGNDGHFQVNDVPVVVDLTVSEETVANAYTMLAFAEETVEPDVDEPTTDEPATEPDNGDDNNDDSDNGLSFIQKLINFFKNIGNFFKNIFGKFFS